MAYSDFTLRRVQKEFSLTERVVPLFRDSEPLALSSWLKETLDMSFQSITSLMSEKARSELIVAPFLLELRKRNNNNFAFYSGEMLNADSTVGLNGECDFLFTKGDIAYTIQSPIFTLMEAKKKDVGEGLGQCAAQMLGARLYNQSDGNEVETIFGCVTTGTEWQFLKLEGQVIYIDNQIYPIDPPERILGILQSIISNYL